MPEIKHNFTGGKMNKDVDERLVPNGEYRDAMNIQVSTSEGSDVGTVQNILGNVEVILPSFIKPDSICVGSVADEKNDAFYWFVREPDTTWNQTIAKSRDVIFEHKNQVVKHVFVDTKHISIAVYSLQAPASGNIIINSQEGFDAINIGDTFQLWQSGVNISVNEFYTVLSKDPGALSINIGDYTNAIWAASWNPSGFVNPGEFQIIPSAVGVLKFPNKIITGIDIIDDMLFWTDGETEPKKINIQRSIEGTDPSGTINTVVINTDANYSILTGHSVQEEHITVIRKAPKNALNLELSNGRDPSLIYTGVTQVAIEQTGTQITSIINSSNPTVQYDFSTLVIGDRVQFTIESDISSNTTMDFPWSTGGFLLLKEFNDDGSHPGIPLANWTIRGLITNWQYNNFNSSNGNVQVEIQVVGLNGTPLDPPSTQGTPLSYVVDYEDTDPVIFEDKFPRFSYRYKYQDGEYSTFAPWSEVAFIPTSFDYDPKKGWNTGMFNTLRSMKVKGFKPTIGINPTGQDIVRVDILYKEDVSPNIYLVETISPVDISSNWWDDEYEIRSETIKNVIASNQLLRSWDNVPKNALAQSISGNRIIYANYEQGYDLGPGYKPNFNNSLVSWSAPVSGTPRKSIKSLRDYKLGVVFSDKYGRETPVLINKSGGFRVEKTDSINANRLNVGLTNNPPADMAWYKFYIKETSTEYYNLAMDRWYKAEDGNIWLAFPSSDRNKVDLETSLYFKRGVDGDDNVIENSTRYKILALENEAPEFIKTRRIRIGTVAHYATARLFGAPTEELKDAPQVNSVSFTMDFDEGGFGGTSLSRMEDIKEDIYIQFVSSSDSSAQYKVSEITSNRDESAATPTPPTEYYVTLDTNLKADINFIFDNALSPTKIKDDTKVVFTKAVIENKPKFDGRFFAKIENDGKIKTQITDESVGVNYIEKAFKTVYLLDHDGWLGERSSAAVVTQGYGNWVTRDYSGFVDGTSGVQAENPGGTNWNFLAARNAYFQKGKNFASTNHTSSSYDLFYYINELFYPGVKSGYEKQWEFKFPVDPSNAGVWFIDRSTKKYELPTSGPDDNSLNWPNDNNMNHASPQCNQASTCGYTGYNGNVGSGITHQPFLNPTSTDIQLGFGGFGGIHGWHYDLTGGSTCTDIIWHTHNTHEDYFGVGTDNNNWNDPITAEFVSALSAGFSFKWREDPTETIYKIEGQTSYQKNLRFGRHDDAVCDPLNTKVLIGALSSYTKTFSFKVTPPMDGWDPAAPTGTYMTNGLHLGDGVFHSATTLLEVTTSSVNPALITLADDGSINSIKVGMSAGTNANIPLAAKVIAVDITSKTVTLDLNVTGTIAIATILEFGFTIRIVTSHMYGIAGNITDMVDNYIIVDNIETECSNGNSLKPTYSLHEGMMLHSYNLDTLPCSGAACEPNDPVIIKKIIQHVDGWKLIMAGYDGPMNHDGNAGHLLNNFVDSERMVFKQVSMNGASNFTESNTDASQVNSPHYQGDPSWLYGTIGAVGYDMVFVEPVDEYSDGGNLPENPFVWETEPKEDTNLDIYHEISENNPITLDYSNINTVIPIGSKIESLSGEGGVWNDISVIYNGFFSGIEIQISEYVWIGPGPATDGTPPLEIGSMLRITKPNGIVFSVKVNGITPHPTTSFLSNRFEIESNLYNSDYFLNWHNCYSFGNGVESNRIKDTFNSPFISNGVKVSTILDQEYKKEHRKHGLIYSGIYNSTSGINNLNQFIAAEKITKDINPIYGSIQKLYAGWGQGGDLVTLCEDRILKILANKDALYNADGNTNVTSTNNVLGTATPYSGEYGISKNPESFASEAYRIYFTDKVRGAVMRLSMDGLTPISMHGMKDWFKDNLKLSNKLIGSYDDKKDEYNITLNEIGEQTFTTTTTINPFSWTGFADIISAPGNEIRTAIIDAQVGDTVTTSTVSYSFPPNTEVISVTNTGAQLVIILSNNLMCDTPLGCDFTIGISLEVTITGDRATTITTADTIDFPSKTVSFREDVRGWVSFKSFIPENGISCANEYYTFADNRLWKHHVEQFDGTGKEIKRNTFYNIPKDSSLSVILNDLPGSVKSFHALNYEGSQSKVNKFIEYNTFGVSGVVVTGTLSDKEYYNLDDKLGWYVENIETNKQKGAVDEFIEKEGKWFNHIKGQEVVSSTAGNITSGFDTANFAIQGIGIAQDATLGSILGCTNPASFNYDPNATINDNSCVAVLYGCTDPGAFNYYAGANVDDGSCLYPGCIDPTAFNFCLTCNLDDGSCIAIVSGCTDPVMFGYDPLANTDDGSCVAFAYGCTDNWTINGCGIGCNEAINYDSSANTPCNNFGTPNDCCEYEVLGCTNPDGALYNSLATVDDGSCLYCGDITANNYDNAVTAAGQPFYGGCEWCVQTTNLHAINIMTTSLDLMWDTPTTNQPQAAGDYYLTITETTGGTIAFQGNIYPITSGAYQSHAVTGLTAGTDYTFEVGFQCTPTNGATDTYSTSTTHIPGCTDDGSGWNAGNLNPAGGEWGACNYLATATQDDGSCEYTSCAGCMDATASNFDPLATQDDGSCTYPIYGCTDISMFNYDPLADIDDGSCLPYIYGCTDTTLDNNGIINNDPTSFAATNYDSTANTPCDAAGTGAGNNECCNYNCPTLAHSAMHSPVWIHQKVKGQVNLLNTYYGTGVSNPSSGSFPNSYVMDVIVTDSAGATIYNSPSTPDGQGGVTQNTQAIHDYKMNFGGSGAGIHLGVPQGTTAISVLLKITTDDGECIVDKTETFTIGCKDTSASNSSSNFDFWDDTQCEYMGCMDDTLNYTGTTYFATNYDAIYTIPCNTTGVLGDPGYDPGEDNDCCEYPTSAPSAIFSASTNIPPTPPSYSSLDLTMYLSNSAYTTAEITEFQVTTPGFFSSGATWNSNNVGGISGGTPWLDHVGGVQDLLNNISYANGSSSFIPNNMIASSPGQFNNLTQSFATGTPPVNALAVNPLEITYKVKYSADINNPSRNNVYEKVYTRTESFSGGCLAGSSIHSNWDPNLVMHIPESCILIPVPGCTDSTALNYNPLANVDDGSCCLVCSVVDPLTVSEPTGSTPNQYTHVNLSFVEACSAATYNVWMKQGTGAWSQIGDISTADPNLIHSGNILSNYEEFPLGTTIGAGIELSFYIITECDDIPNSSIVSSNQSNTYIISTPA